MMDNYNLLRRPALIRNGFIILLFLVLIQSSFGQIKNRTGLLVIDVQENLVNPDSRIHIDTLGLGSFFSNVNEAIQKSNQNGYEVIYVVNEWTNPIQNWMTGNVCKKGGKGVELDRRLTVTNQKIYSKSKPNALTNFELRNYLIEQKFSDIYVAGLLAEGCVKATVKGLIKNNFKVIVIEDALGSKNLRNKNAALDYFEKQGIKKIKAKEL